MHCPQVTPSPWQGSGGGEAPEVHGFYDSKAIRKPVYESNIEGKIHMLFCNEYSINVNLYHFHRRSMSEIPHPWCQGPGVQLPEAHWS